MSLSLDVALREGTKPSHSTAESTAFMKCFLKGVIDRNVFRKFLADLYFVYSALEVEMQRHQHHPVIGSVYFPELHRAEGLAQDLAFYYGLRWRSEVEPSPAAKVYLERIQSISDSDPSLLLAHAYTRYMGDLSGGQALRSIIRLALNLPPQEGTHLYEFATLPTPEARRSFKERYRQALREVPLDESTAQRIVDEANTAFSLNCHLMEALEADLRMAIGEEVFELITRSQAPKAACPMREMIQRSP
ncbi:heme oxygenase (biliverdin-producing) [Geitlerinema sp. PCC 7407]|uniref:biliverdin-producing heme oxygenase n=1 Tax=Geitlerinema sp. PCC 7407 TaxID=1173025 RepID=UPI00029FC97D|nr:biliverdin-producing heme oxygenase [Geitlerinema sp. PCC 7407]AFY66454.1 Heme oxygenase [Geitlerinema sp. PCC 7407]